MKSSELPLNAERKAFVSNRVLLIVAGAAIWSAAVAMNQYGKQGPVVCPLHGLVGLPCPGCGLTRAFCALAQGRLWEAARLNALSFVLGPLMVVASVVAALELLRQERYRFYRFLFSTRLAYWVGVIVLLYHLGRCCWMWHTGELYNGYVKSSWVYRAVEMGKKQSA